jgi:hypothetical protein
MLWAAGPARILHRTSMRRCGDDCNLPALRVGATWTYMRPYNVVGINPEPVPTSLVPTAPDRPLMQQHAHY